MPGTSGAEGLHLVLESVIGHGRYATAIGVGIAAGTATYLPNQASTVNSTGSRKPILLVQLPPGPYERYLGILKTVATTECTAGAVNAYLTKNPKLYTSLPDAI